MGSSYAYDGHGRRTKIVSGDGSIHIQVYSQGGQLLWSEKDSCPNGTTPSGGQCTSTLIKTAYIYLEGKQIAETVIGGVTQYVHTDALGSPVAHTNQAGAELNRTKFEPYGGTAAGTKPGRTVTGLTTTGSAIGFTGHVHDPDTDLVYMQQRYYDPIAGRFLSIDPVTTDANTGGSFNRYAYANNSPYKYTDPDGRLAFLIPFIPYIATATVAVIGHYALPGRQGREASLVAIFNSGKNAPGTVGSDKGCIYLCDGVSPGQKTTSGRPYVGSANDLEARAKGARDGRDRTEATVIGEYDKGDKEGRANNEQNGINEQGGKSNLDNKRDEVAEKKWGNREIKPPEEKKSE